jgi:hypothetical protein
MSDIVSIEKITSKIYVIRDTRLMLDRDLAQLYGVETKALKQAVRRNISRFPEDFVFELTKEEFRNWRSQFVTSNQDKMGDIGDVHENMKTTLRTSNNDCCLRESFLFEQHGSSQTGSN